MARWDRRGRLRQHRTHRGCQIDERQRGHDQHRQRSLGGGRGKLAVVIQDANDSAHPCLTICHGYSLPFDALWRPFYKTEQCFGVPYTILCRRDSCVVGGLLGKFHKFGPQPPSQGMEPRQAAINRSSQLTRRVASFHMRLLVGHDRAQFVFRPIAPIRWKNDARPDHSYRDWNPDQVRFTQIAVDHLARAH